MDLNARSLALVSVYPRSLYYFFFAILFKSLDSCGELY